MCIFFKNEFAEMTVSRYFRGDLCLCPLIVTEAERDSGQPVGHRGTGESVYYPCSAQLASQKSRLEELPLGHREVVDSWGGGWGANLDTYMHTNMHHWKVGLHKLRKQ